MQGKIFIMHHNKINLMYFTSYWFNGILFAYVKLLRLIHDYLKKKPQQNNYFTKMFMSEEECAMVVAWNHNEINNFVVRTAWI